MPDEFNYVLTACMVAAFLYLYFVVRPMSRKLGDGPLNRAQQRLRWRVYTLGYGGGILWALAIVALARTIWPVGVGQGMTIFGVAALIALAALEGWCARRMLALADGA